jgi:hypothetical protein
MELDHWFNIADFCEGPEKFIISRTSGTLHQMMCQRYIDRDFALGGKYDTDLSVIWQYGYDIYVWPDSIHSLPTSVREVIYYVRRRFGSQWKPYIVRIKEYMPKYFNGKIDHAELLIRQKAIKCPYRKLYVNGESIREKSNIPIRETPCNGIPSTDIDGARAAIDMYNTMYSYDINGKEYVEYYEDCINIPGHLKRNPDQPKLRPKSKMAKHLGYFGFLELITSRDTEIKIRVHLMINLPETASWQYYNFVFVFWHPDSDWNNGNFRRGRLLSVCHEVEPNVRILIICSKSDDLFIEQDSDVKKILTFQRFGKLSYLRICRYAMGVDISGIPATQESAEYQYLKYTMRCEFRPLQPGYPDIFHEEEGVKYMYPMDISEDIC